MKLKLLCLLTLSFTGVFGQGGKVKIELQGFQEREGFNINYNDFNGENKPPIAFYKFKEQEVDLPNPTMFYRTDPYSIPFFVYPGERIVIVKEGKYFSARIPGNDERTNELKLLKEVVLRYGPMNGGSPADDRIYMESFKTKIIDPVLFLFNLYQDRLHFLDSFKMKYALTASFDQFARNYFFYHFLDRSIHYLNRNGASISEYEILKNSISGADLAARDSSLLYIDKYRSFLVNYCSYITANTQKKTDLLLQITQANLKFAGDAKDYLLFVLAKQALNGDLDTAMAVVKVFIDNCKSSEYVSIIKNEAMQLRDEYFAKSREFSEDGQTAISLLDIIGQTRARLIYIDIWASWCIPCLNEMPHSKDLQEKYRENENIAFLYISIDSSLAFWSKGKKLISKFVVPQFSYLLLNGPNAKFAKSVGLNTIPRYILVDGTGQILHPNAPRPGDPAIYQIIDGYLEKLQIRE